MGMRSKLDSFRLLLADLASVKSESGRDAMLEECQRSLDGLSEALEDTSSKWTRFDSLLGDYKYQFGKRKKKGLVVDHPNQQIMEFEKQEK